ncbi:MULTISPECIES: ABC transporter ATP-binding protein [Acidithrix]|uniref:Teichoic acids export ATP-binding protein TagH n=1 Tax=Acidithrix ferrooxidans TaxID=1280514 RepID=A0A0D8HHR9_9ACTN|nr:MULTISPECIES: ABC transporter ATP-binding protein [Acidithrix]KJF17389.1 teichoic acids export ATP-binding protein TagH [Acidithrix ferrooxidans]CAG4927830.1 unnamed protein product [Acidithrix sp. C25]
MANAIEIDGVTKIFRLYSEKYTSLKERVIHAGKNPYQEFYALRDVTFNIEEGSTVGLLGHNGSGKSTLLKTMAGILQPTKGEIRIKGRVSAMLEIGAGFHQELTGRDNIFLSATLLGLPVKEVEGRFDEIVEFSELGKFIDNQVKHYSSGMYARLGFAVAVNVDPDVLLVDEVLAVGDENFQRKCIERIKLFQREGRTIVFVSHSPDLVRTVCQSAYVLDHGSLIGRGEPSEAIAALRDSLGRGGVGGSLIGDESSTAQIDPTALVVEQAVTVTALKCFSGVGQENDHISPHDSLNVHVAYHTQRPIGDVSLTIQFLSPQGETIFAGNTKDLDLPGYDIDGDGVFELYFESLPLLDGVYGIVAMIIDASGTLVSWIEEKAAFQVMNPSKVSGLVALTFRVTSSS